MLESGYSPGEYWILVIRPSEYTGIWLFASGIKNDFAIKNKYFGIGKCYLIKNYNRISKPGPIYSNLLICPGQCWNLVIGLGEYIGIWLFAVDTKNDVFH